MAETAWPREIRLSPDKKRLTVTWEDGSHQDLAAELLRIESPSAEVQGHSPQGKQLVRDKGAVRITAVEPVGNYAVRLTFDDGHSTGIYGWTYLRELAAGADTIMRRYRDAVASR